MEIAVIIFLIAVFLLLMVLWKRGKQGRRDGFWHRLRVRRRDAARIQLEDALKHIYDYEYNHLACTLESIAGTLSLTPDVAAKLIGRLGEMQLIAHDGRQLKLTEEGREYALRVIRIHRLWERHLADETSVRELDWHRDADRKEHLLTSEETGVLAKRLGHPPFDPHGDPIPTVEGVIPVQRGKPLLDYKVHDAVKVIHVEDEPAAVYAQLVQKKIFPGIVASVVASSPDGIELETEGRRVFLSALVAANVSVARFEKPEVLPKVHRTLHSLRVGESGKVIGISQACRGAQRRRLMDLGIVPGTEVTSELQSVSGDPVGYMIRGATIALRKQQAELIYIE